MAPINQNGLIADFLSNYQRVDEKKYIYITKKIYIYMGSERKKL